MGRKLHRIVVAVAGDISEGGLNSQMTEDKLTRWAKLIVKHRDKKTIGKQLLFYVDELLTRHVEIAAGQCLALAAIALADPHAGDSVVEHTLGKEAGKKFLGKAKKLQASVSAGAGLAVPGGGAASFGLRKK